MTTFSFGTAARSGWIGILPVGDTGASQIITFFTPIVLLSTITESSIKAPFSMQCATSLSALISFLAGTGPEKTIWPLMSPQPSAYSGPAATIHPTPTTAPSHDFNDVMMFSLSLGDTRLIPRKQQRRSCSQQACRSCRSFRLLGMRGSVRHDNCDLNVQRGRSRFQ